MTREETVALHQFCVDALVYNQRKDIINGVEYEEIKANSMGEVEDDIPEQKVCFK